MSKKATGKRALLGWRFPHPRWAASDRRFEISVGEVVLFGFFLILVAGFGLRDWLTVGYASTINERVTAIEKNVLGLTKFAEAQGTLTRMEMLEHADQVEQRNRAAVLENRAVLCAILTRVGGRSPFCPRPAAR